MDRATRDKMTAKTDQKNLAYGESACLETPPELFAALHEEFHFDIDLTANEHNHLLPRWFGPKGLREDALTASWYFLPTVAQEKTGVPIFQASTSGFSNPPYGLFLPKILEKAVYEAQLGFTSVFLLPSRITRHFKKHVLGYANYRYVETRVTFWYQGKPKPTALNKHTGELEPAGALFDSIIAVFEPPARAHLRRPTIWHWDPKVRADLPKRYPWLT